MKDFIEHIKKNQIEYVLVFIIGFFAAQIGKEFVLWQQMSNTSAYALGGIIGMILGIFFMAHFAGKTDKDK